MGIVVIVVKEGRSVLLGRNSSQRRRCSLQSNHLLSSTVCFSFVLFFFLHFMRRGYETRSLPLPKLQTAGSGVFGRDEKNAAYIRRSSGTHGCMRLPFSHVCGGEKEKEKAAFL